jgi:hypothetical protein
LWRKHFIRQGKNSLPLCEGEINGLSCNWNYCFGFDDCFCWNATNGNFVFDVRERKNSARSRKKLSTVLERKQMILWLVLEDCCNHFTGLFATEAEAKACVEEYGDGFSYSECVV